MAVVFKGYNPPFGFNHAGLAHVKLQGVTGGIHINKEIHRTMAYVAEAYNPSKVTSGIMAKTGLILDVITD
ncbi:hypothetical protein [Conservatibacter flavescens]|uniref:hypothetical protein n=1 Tax=Conservatibacter flavescens TaxID=28161 RepID=UPI0013FD1D7F|nr:hypothetical protein [Conservatibacter flavescens]